MTDISYTIAPVPVRDDLLAAHRRWGCNILKRSLPTGGIVRYR